MAEWEIVGRDVVDTLGEGPLWSGSDQRLYWVDIMAPAINALGMDGRIDRWSMPEPVGWVVERQGGGLLAGFKSGVAEIDLDPIAIEHWCAPEPERPHNRLNDAKVDREGRLWFGSKDDRDLEPLGALYRMGPDRTAVRMDDGYLVTNGPTFSPDGKWLYHTDSSRRLIYRFPLAEDGSLGRREIFIRFAEEWGYPDGMTTDAEGCLWVAHWAGGAISRFDADGRRMESIALPATNITSCAFGGPGFDRLYVTSAALDSPGNPADGALFVVEAGIRGTPAFRYAG